MSWSVRTAYADPQTRWIAVSSRSKEADGLFFYAVKTTKIYCRTSCKARLARRSNVEFYDTPREAEAAGFRPCKRCRPELASYTPDTDLVNKVSAILDRLPPDASPPNLEDLASEVGLTKFHFHRMFKRVTNMTPRAYILAKRHAWISTPELSSNGSTVSTEPHTPVIDAPPEQTPEKALTMLGEKSWFGDDLDLSNLLDFDIDPLLIDVQLQDSPTVIYDTMLTASGLLLVVYKHGEICKVQLDSIDVDVMTHLARDFPPDQHTTLHVNQLESVEANLLMSYTAAIAEAINRPNGTLLDLPFSKPLEQMLEVESG